MTECKLLNRNIQNIYSDRVKSVRGWDVSRKKDSGVNEKQNSVLIINRVNIHVISYAYIAAYPTSKEKAVVSIICIHYQPS